MIKVLVFDLDDTLFPESEFIKSGFNAVDEWIFKKYAKSNFFEVSWDLFIHKNRNNVFNLALEKLNIDYDSNTIEELVKIYRNHRPIISLYEDARWAMDYFKVFKKMGLITDGYLNTQKNKVSALGIEPIVDSIVYSDFYGREHWKPSPVPYQKMMESMDCEGQECVYIGDNPSKDFVMAKKLGWLTIQVNRIDAEYSNVSANLEYQAALEISSLTDLKEIFIDI